MSNQKHRGVILGVTAIAFDTHFTMQTVRPLETAILEVEPTAKKAGIKYPVKAFHVKGICQVQVETEKETKKLLYFKVDGRKVERYIAAVN